MKFNTAVFYDIENLLGGGSFRYEDPAQLDLARIVESIRQSKLVDRFAVQRAYANWSDPRLAPLRKHLNKLGIEPIQVFGFSYDARKNAADIQLAIDAIDLVHVRPVVEVFVVVSGDGGFSALAKKLHEYGKAVIGCANRSVTSDTFRAVCDEFIPIADEALPASGSGRAGEDAARPAQNRAERPAKKTDAPRIPDSSLVSFAREGLCRLAADASLRDELSAGVSIQTFRETLTQSIPGFDQRRAGYPKFVEFLQCVSAGTPLCVARPATASPSSEPLLFLREGLAADAVVLPSLPEREPHSPESYLAILGFRPHPVYHYPTPEALYAVAEWASATRHEAATHETILAEATAALGTRIPPDEIRDGLYACIAAGAYEREPEGKQLKDQTLTTQPDVRSAADAMHLIRATAHRKLAECLGEPRGEILDQLFPTHAGPVPVADGSIPEPIPVDDGSADSTSAPIVRDEWLPDEGA